MCVVVATNVVDEEGSLTPDCIRKSDLDLRPFARSLYFYFRRNCD